MRTSTGTSTACAEIARTGRTESSVAKPVTVRQEDCVTERRASVSPSNSSLKWPTHSRHMRVTRWRQAMATTTTAAATLETDTRSDRPLRNGSHLADTLGRSACSIVN